MSKLVALAAVCLLIGVNWSAAASETAAKQPTLNNPLMPKAAKALSRTQAAKVVGRGEIFPILYVLPVVSSEQPMLAATFPIPVTTYGNTVPPLPPPAALDNSYGLVTLRTQTLIGSFQGSDRH